MGKELAQILLAYRRTIHTATGKSTEMLMLGRQIQSRLDLLLPNNVPSPDEDPFRMDTHISQTPSRATHQTIELRRSERQCALPARFADGFSH